MGNSATRSAERASPIGGGGDAAANAPVSDYKPVLGTRGLPTLAELMAFRRAEAERELTARQKSIVDQLMENMRDTKFTYGASALAAGLLLVLPQSAIRARQAAVAAIPVGVILDMNAYCDYLWAHKGR